MRQASQASKTRVLRLKEPLSVRTVQFCRIGRAEPHNPAGISAHATHKQHRPRFYTAWIISGQRQRRNVPNSDIAAPMTVNVLADLQGQRHGLELFFPLFRGFGGRSFLPFLMELFHLV